MRMHHQSMALLSSTRPYISRAFPKFHLAAPVTGIKVDIRARQLFLFAVFPPPTWAT
jgi:hypothetical protein